MFPRPQRGKPLTERPVVRVGADRTARVACLLPFDLSPRQEKGRLCGFGGPSGEDARCTLDYPPDADERRSGPARLARRQERTPERPSFAAPLSAAGAASSEHAGSCVVGAAGGLPAVDGPPNLTKVRSAARCGQKGEGLALHVYISEPSARPTLRDFLERHECVVRERNAYELDIDVTRALSEEQAHRELDVYLATWQAFNPGIEAYVIEPDGG
jgi:hypothetical protein